MRLNVPDMSCGHCKASIEAAIARAAPGAAVEVDLPAREVHVSASLPPAQIIAALNAAGFSASEI